MQRTNQAKPLTTQEPIHKSFIYRILISNPVSCASVCREKQNQSVVRFSSQTLALSPNPNSDLASVYDELHLLLECDVLGPKGTVKNLVGVKR